MSSVEEQLGRLFAEMEAEQAPFTIAEIVGDTSVENWDAVPTPSPRRGWMLAAAVFVVLVVGAAFVLAARSSRDPAPVAPIDTPPPTSTVTTSPVEPVTDAVGGDPRSYFTVDDALRYAGGSLRIGDEPGLASRDEIAELLAGGENLEGTDPEEAKPNLFFVGEPDQITDGEQLFAPSGCQAYGMGGIYTGYPADPDGRWPVGLAEGLPGAFQAIADGGGISPDWVYVDWYDGDLTYDEAKVLFDQSVLSWILSRGHVFGRGYSGSKIAVTLSPDPTAPWNQAVIDHPFLRPVDIGNDPVDDLGDLMCDTFLPMEPL